MSFWEELKRRNVFKVGAGYAVVAWLIVQVAAAALPNFDAPRWIIQTIFLLLFLGFPVALRPGARAARVRGRAQAHPRRLSVTRPAGARLGSSTP